MVAKEALVKDKLDSLFTNVSLDRNYHFQLGEIQRLDLFSDPSRCTGNDMLEADYREVRFAQSDICVWEQNRKVDANGNVYVHGSGAESLVFKGRMIRMDFRKPFEGRVQVLSTNFKNAKRSRRITSAIAGNAEERAAWSQVETELESFNQSFDVFSPRERDAFETLTPQMIEGIDLLWQRLRVPLAFCFEGHSMYVFIDSDGRDAFEVSARRTALETQTRLEEDAQIIVDFMETMYFRKQ